MCKKRKKTDGSSPSLSPIVQCRYTRNAQRVILDLNAAGPSLGDQVIVNGAVFEPSSPSGGPPPATGGPPPVGRFDLSATTTAVLNATAERRQVFIEDAFNPGVMPDFFAPAASLKTALGNNNNNNNNNNDTTAAAFSRALAASGDALEMSGVETYPPNGAILSTLITFAVTGGTGALIGARGQVLIEFDAASQSFKYTFTLL